jgi:hypothetical protein
MTCAAPALMSCAFFSEVRGPHPARQTGILSVAAWHDQIGDENLHGGTVLAQRRRSHRDQPLVRARL